MVARGADGRMVRVFGVFIANILRGFKMSHSKAIRIELYLHTYSHMLRKL